MKRKGTDVTHGTDSSPLKKPKDLIVIPCENLTIIYADHNGSLIPIVVYLSYCNMKCHWTILVLNTILSRNYNEQYLL